MAEKKSSVKKRNWAFVVYPSKAQLDQIGCQYDGWDGYGSLPDDWVTRLQLSGLMFAISPLHDQDKHEDGSGRLKKPHYHVIVVYGSPTTFKNVQALTESLNAPIPIPLEQVRGYYRYFTHEDNPDKHQYDKVSIVAGGGFDISDFVELSKSEVTAIKDELTKLIRKECMTEYSAFVFYVQDNLDRTYFDVASGHTIYFNSLIKSIRFSLTKGSIKADVDPDTGAVSV